MKSKFILACIPAALALSAACHEVDNGTPSGGSAPVESFDATTAREWFDLLTATIDAENLNPPEASRRIGYAGVAFYEALVGGMTGYRSLGGQLNELGALPAAPAGILHWPAVANAATADVLRKLFPGAASQMSIDAKEAALEAQFLMDTDQATLDRSIQHGQAIALAIGTWIDGDDYVTYDNCAYTPPSGDGLWVPIGTQTALEPCWGSLRCFVLADSAECDPIAPLPFSKDPGSAFALEAEEVYDAVNNLTLVQETIAQFWADGAGSLTPPGHWVSIAGQVLEQEGVSLAVAAEAYAKIGIAVADAFISCWHVKFVHNLLRPITYIQDPTGPINDPGWTSLIGTPPFPEYTSGHSTQSGAAAMLLTDLLGPVSFTDLTHRDNLGIVRFFDDFEQAADEAAISRLYGGIHFRAAIERGLEEGECIAQMILDNVQFRN